VTDTTQANPNVCYRHPNRQSWVLCQRCGRTICPSCQIQAAVGVQCPECVAEGHRESPRVRRAGRRAAGRFGAMFRPGSQTPIVTWGLSALLVVVFLAQLFSGDRVTEYLLYWGPYTGTQPWRMLTAALAHGGWLHILFNLWALLSVGPTVEMLVGRWRMLALVVLTAFGGSVAVLLLAPGTPVIGASGIVFGLFAAAVVLLRGLGANPGAFVAVIVVNLLIGFIPGMNVAWQAHVGGLVVGAATAAAIVWLNGRRRRGAQLGAIAGIAAALVLLTLAGVGAIS